MKWHLTDDQKKKLQREDELQFKKFFSKRSYNTTRIAENPVNKTPDYELSKHDIKVITEIKSKFGNDEYGRISTLITNRLSKLRYGYNYDFSHFFETMPSQNDIDNILGLVEQEMTSLPKDIRLPYTLRLGHYEVQNSYKQLIEKQPENRNFFEKEMESVYSGFGNGQVVITLAEKNNENELICEMVSGGTSNYPGTRDKGYFKNVIKTARKQLADYIDNYIVGLVFYNHSSFDWHDNDIISLFGDLQFRFRPNSNEYSIALGANRIISEDSKTWLSYLGFFSRSDEDYLLTVYRNGFAAKELPLSFFDAPNCIVKTIKLDDDRAHILII